MLYQFENKFYEHLINLSWQNYVFMFSFAKLLFLHLLLFWQEKYLVRLRHCEYLKGLHNKYTFLL